MKLSPTAELFLAQAERLVKDAKPLFADKPPAVISMALAELVALHFASTPANVRDAARDEFMRNVDGMVSAMASRG